MGPDETQQLAGIRSRHEELRLQLNVLKAQLELFDVLSTEYDTISLFLAQVDSIPGEVIEDDSAMGDDLN